MEFSLDYFIKNYGYLALFVGTFLEGETIMILCGIAAYSGHLDITYVLLTGFAGTFFGDQLYFYIGRCFRDKVKTKLAKWKKKVDKVHRILEKHDVWLILSFRFFYGLRNVTPFAIGTAKTSAIKYFGLNFIGASVWAMSFAFGGYYLGSVADKFFAGFKKVQIYIFGGIILLAVIMTVIKLIRKNSNSNGSNGNS